MYLPLPYKRQNTLFKINNTLKKVPTQVFKLAIYTVKQTKLTLK